MLSSELLVGGLCVHLVGSLVLTPSMEGGEVCNGLSRNGDNWSDGDVNEGDRSRGGSRAVGEAWLKMRVNLTSTNSSSGPTATWQ